MKQHFVLCIDNSGYPESLEKRKFYEVVPDDSTANEGMIRIIDESGESYLYSKEMFIEFTLPTQIEQALKAA